MAFENFTTKFGQATKEDEDAPAFSNFQKQFGGTSVKLATPPPEISIAEPSVAPKTNSFVDFAKKVGEKVESTTYKLGQYAEREDYTPNLFKDTLKEIGSLEHLRFGIGAIIQTARKDPETVANLAWKDFPKSLLDAGKELAKLPADVVLSVAGGLLSPVLKNQGAMEFDLPGLGKVTNMQARAIERVEAGEPVWLVVATAVPEAIFDTLFLVGMTQKFTSPRPVTVTKGEIPKDFGITMKKPPKSFRHHTQPQYYQPLPPGALEAIAQQKGFQLGPKYTPGLPTYFQITGKANGIIQGSVVQVKPSFVSQFFGKFKGNVTKVSPEMLETFYTQQTSVQAIANAKPTTAPAVPVVTPKAPTTKGVVETLKEMEQQPNAVVKTDPEVGKVVETPMPVAPEITPKIEPERGGEVRAFTQLGADLEKIPGFLATKPSGETKFFQSKDEAEGFVAIDRSGTKKPVAESGVEGVKSDIAEVKETVSRIEGRLTPIREADGVKIKTPTFKTAYNKGVIVKGKYKDKPYTTDTFVLEFEDVKVQTTRDEGPTSDAVQQVVNKTKGAKNLGAPVEVITGGTTNQVIFKLGKEEVVMDAKYYNYLSSKYKGLVLKGTGPQNPIGIYDGKAMKGVVMPVQGRIKGKDVKTTKLKTPSGDAMAKYDPKDLPKITGKLGSFDKIRPVEMPELVRMVRELTGKFPDVVKSTGDAAGRFYHADGRIKLIASLFAQGPAGVNQAGRVLAHEIGHLIDWLPDHMMKRGNLLGRLRSLHNFLSSTFSETAGQGLDLKTLRNEALKEVLSAKDKTFSEYVKNKDLRAELKPEIEKVYQRKIQESGAIKDATIRKELLAVTRYWHPYDPKKVPASYKKYRESGKELYAEAISVLLNDPAVLEKMAPTFYEQFFKGLNTKLDVKRAYFELQELLSGTPEAIFKARMDDVLAGFARAEAIQADFRAKKKLSDLSIWERMRQQVDDVNYPITKRQQEAEAKGKIFTEEDNPKFLLQELSMADNENFIFVEKINKDIVKPLQDAGMSLEDIGQYLKFDRILNDRSELANPGGHTPETARDYLENLRRIWGEENTNLIEEKVRLLHDVGFISIEEAVRVGSYNRETFEKIILPNKYSYAPFRVVDHMQENMPATIKAQFGTLKEIDNPFISFILKTIALNRLNAYQRAKNATIKMFQRDFPSEISETRRITTDGKLSIFKPADGKGTIEVFEDGKMASYDVDPYIAESFKHDKVGDLNLFVELADKFNNKFFKPVVTTYNLGFAVGTNPIRDFKRNYKLIPNATVKDLLIEYFKAIPSSFRYAAGDLDEFTRMLVEAKAMNAPMNDYAFDDVDTQFAAVLERYGIIKANQRQLDNKAAEAVRKALIVPTMKLLNGIKFLANTFEAVSKIAGSRVRMKGGESGRELSYNVRNYTGTPNFRVKGAQTKNTNALFVFSNVIKESYKTDIQIATRPNSRSGYWWKTVKIDLFPKFLQFLAYAGVLGPVLKEVMEKATEYDKTNYIIIPLGIKDNGKAVYGRIPHDESGRFVSAVFWKLANAIEDGGSTKDLQDVFALGAGQFPTLTPLIDVTSGWAQYAAGKNPYDGFRGRQVIDDLTWEAGGGAAFKKMVAWTISDLGLAKISTYDDATKTGLETAIELTPWFSSMIKITDYGLQERYGEVGREQKQKEAQQSLLERDLINKYHRLYVEDPSMVSEYAKSLVQDALDGRPVTEREVDRTKRLLTKFAKTLIAGESVDAREKAVSRATSNAQKAAILKAIQGDVGPVDFRRLVEDMYADKIISDNVLKLLIPDN